MPRADAGHRRSCDLPFLTQPPAAAREHHQDQLEDQLTTYSGLNSNWCYWDQRTWTSLPNNDEGQR